MSTHVESSQGVQYSRAQLLVILLTPILVVLSSTALYFSGWLMPKGTSNEGYLLNPVLSVEDFGLPQVPITQERSWQMIQFSPSCDLSCLNVAQTQRQLHIALGKHQPRMKRVLLTSSDVSVATIKSLFPIQTSTFQTSDLSPKLLDAISQQHLQDNPIFIADPFGNIMLYFTSEHDYKAQLHDLKTLLKASTIG